MKRFSKMMALILCLAMLLMLAACGQEQPGTDPTTTPTSKPADPTTKPTAESTEEPTGGAEKKSVGKIEILTEPAKMDYWEGEVFDPEGGIILVTYRDNSTEEVPMNDPSVELPNVKTNSTGRKAVKVTFGGKSATFYIVVAEKGEDVTYHMNYEGAPDAQVVPAKKDSAAKEPEAPVREGYTFDKWYIDPTCTVAYDFATVVAEPIDLYASWKENDATYHEVIYHLNYYGTLPVSYSQIVKDGENARAIGLTPAREEFTFGGWYTDIACTEAFDPDAVAITEDTTVYAKWNKVKTGVSTYLFEAEFTNLVGKEGPGMSGSASGASMIVNDMTDLGASGGKFVSYLYKQGLSLEFYVASSETVTDATLTIRVAAELDNININSSTYTVEVNGVKMEYDALSLVTGAGFSDSIVIKNVTLNEGANVIKLITNNNVNPMGEGMGTYQGTAPMIDCIKIETGAVVTWDENFSLPMKY